MERDCCEFICGAPTTFQGFGIEQLFLTPSGLPLGCSTDFLDFFAPVLRFACAFRFLVRSSLMTLQLV